MTLIEAFEFTLEKIEEIKSKGVLTKIVPHNSAKSEKIVLQYQPPVHLPSDKWVHVSFRNNNEQDSGIVFDAVKYLGLCGIKFDSGSGFGEIDWELDWSFAYNKQEQSEFIENLSLIEDFTKEILTPDNVEQKEKINPNIFSDN